MSGSDSPTIVRDGLVLDVAARRAHAADVLVRDGRIAEIGPPGMSAPDEASVVDARDRLLVPGLVNAHTHGHGALAKGSGDAWTLELLLNAAPWIAGNRAPRHKYLSTLLGALEMVSKGCTACYDLYAEVPLPTREGLEAVGRAYTDAGMRATVAPMIADRTFYEAIPGLLESLPGSARRDAERIRAAPGPATLAACRDLLASWPFDRARIRPALAPTIPLLCSDEFIRASRDVAREHGAGLHMHLAESKIQALAGVERYGKSLTAQLDDLGFLSPELTAAHVVWPDGDDIRRLADNGVKVAHNPGSNMRLGSGLAPAAEMHAAGVELAIGTDGAQCADNQNMFEAMRLASFASRVRSHDHRDWLTTDAVLGMATEGGARALGLGDDLGRLAPGYAADIAFLDLGDFNLVPLNDPVNQIVHSEDGNAVDGVMIGGRTVYWRREFTSVDTSALRAEVAQAREELLDLNRNARAVAEKLEAHVSAFCVGLARRPHHVHAMAGRDH